MMLVRVIFVIFLKILVVDNRMIPLNYMTIAPPKYEEIPAEQIMKDPNEKVIELKSNEERDQDEVDLDVERKSIEKTNKKPCAVVVMSNIQHPNTQSLLRRYRYNANGVLIPSSVKYFIKLPQGLRASPILIPLNDKSFSPLGGFVRYYKEVPPIPRSW